MKNFNGIILLLILLILNSQTYGQVKITLQVAINDLRNSDGEILIRLADDHNATIAKQIIMIKKGKTIAVFDGLSSGKYAVSYIHDENSNGELDSGVMGIPSEGYGFSNDARGFMGPPDFEDQVFELKANTVLTLKTKYW